MGNDQQAKTGLFPRGVIAISLAAMLERFGYFMVFASLIGFLHEALWTGADEVSTLLGVYTLAAAALGVLGGFLGDVAGHRRIAVIGAAITAFALLLLSLPVEGDRDAAWVVIVLALVLLATGRGVFPVNTSALTASLHDGARPAAPLAGSLVVVHLAGNIGALAAPFAGEGLRAFGQEAFGLWGGESFHLVTAFASQAVLGAMTVLLVRGGVLGAAERRVRDAVRDGRGHADFHRTARQAATGLPLVILSYAVFYVGYQLSFGAQHEFARQLVGEPLGRLESINPLVVVLAAPLVVWLLTAVARRVGRVRISSFMAVGMAVVAAGLAVLLVGALVAPEPADGFAPPWKADAPSLGWPIASLGLVALGELLVVPLYAAFALTASPRRVRGLLLGVAIAAAGQVAFLVRFTGDALAGLSLAGRTALQLGCVILAAVAVFVVGLALRRRDEPAPSAPEQPQPEPAIAEPAAEPTAEPAPAGPEPTPGEDDEPPPPPSSIVE